jgi:hypothetical protein
VKASRKPAHAQQRNKRAMKRFGSTRWNGDLREGKGRSRPRAAAAVGSKPSRIGPAGADTLASAAHARHERAVKRFGSATCLTGLILSAQNMRVGTNVAIQTLLSDVLRPLLAAGLVWLFAVSLLTAREAILLSALPAGFFGVLFGLRCGLSSDVVGTTLIASAVLSAATLAAAIYLTASMGQ